MLIFQCEMFDPLCVEWHISNDLIQAMLEIHTQANSNLTNLSTFTSEESHILLVGLTVYNYRFQIWFSWLVVLVVQFNWQQFSGSIANLILSSKWKKSNLSSLSDRTNCVVTQDPINHNLGHPKVWNKSYLVFKPIE